MEKKRVRLIGMCALIALMVSGTTLSLAQGPDPFWALRLSDTIDTSFIYQGRLLDGDSPADGTYDLQFELHDHATNDSQVGSTFTEDDATVTDGYFTVVLDFGDVFDGTALWLEVGVRSGAETGAYTTLDPRQPLTAAPYANHALSTGALQGYPITTTAPSSGQVLEWTGNAWAPAVAGSGIGDITAVSAGHGLGGGGTSGDVTLNVVTSTIQSRVTGNCSAGFSISTINQDGTVLCETDDDTTYTEGEGLLLSSEEFSVHWGGTGSALTVARSDHTHTGYIQDDNEEVGDADVSIGGLSPNRISGTAWTGSNDGSGSGLDADMLDGQSSAYYRSATSINGGTLNTDFYSAYADLGAEGYLGDASGDLAQNNGTLQINLNADLLDGQHASAFASDTHDHWGDTWSGTGAGLTLTGTNTSGSILDVTNTGAGGGDFAIRTVTGDGSGLFLSGSTAGILADGDGGYSIVGFNNTGYGVYGFSTTGTGVYAIGGAADLRLGGGAGTILANALSSSDLQLRANDYVDIYLDDDNDSTSLFRILNGTNSVVFSVNESGHLSGGTLSGSDVELHSNDYVSIHLDDDNNSSSLFSILNGSDTTVFSIDEAGDIVTGGGHTHDTYWNLSGNSGTTAGTDFLGTTDNEPLELHVNGARALRLEPDSASPNVIGGYSGNNATSGAHGATVGGGGQSGWLNEVTDNFGTVGGGARNVAGNDDGDVGNRGWATVGGGYINTASGQVSTIGGGSNNIASNDYASVLGGYQNTASGQRSTVGGGSDNTASGDYASVPGGYDNTAQGDYSLAAGRQANADHDGTFVWADSTAADFSSTGQDQFLVRASGGVTLNVSVGGLHLLPHATSPNFVGGYSGNNVTTGVYGGTVGGGGASGVANNVTDIFGTVGGGAANQAGDNAGTTNDRAYATVGGGGDNTASGIASTVAGGYANTSSGLDATVGGGYYNTASGEYATVPGGRDAQATLYGQIAHASGDFAGFGDAQASEYVLRNTTTDATQTELYLDGSSERLTIGSERTMTFDVLIVGRTNNGVSAGYIIQGAIERYGGTTQLLGTPWLRILGEDDSSWGVIATADDTNEALLIQVTGAASTTIRWVAVVRSVEVVY